MTLMVPIDDERVAEQGGRTTFAEAVSSLHIAEVFLPLQISLEVEAEESARSEKSEYVFAVGDGRAGSETVVRVVALVRHLFIRHARPERLAGLAIEAHEHELVGVRWLGGA